MPEYQVIESSGKIVLTSTPTLTDPDPVPLLTWELEPDPFSFNFEIMLMEVLGMAWTLNHPGSYRL